MKSLFIGLIVLFNISKIRSFWVSSPSNFDLNSIKNYNELMPCKFNKECISGISCVMNDCLVGEFLCFEGEGKNCTTINNEVYDTIREEFIIYDNEEEFEEEITLFGEEEPLTDEEKQEEQEKEEEKQPILKSCYKDFIDNCNTEPCEEDSDCISGSCILNKCVSDTPVHLCTYTINKNVVSFYCGKQSNMPCSNNNECYSGLCNGVCMPPVVKNLHNNKNNRNKVLLGILIVVIVIFICTLLYYLKICYDNKKNKQAKKKATQQVNRHERNEQINNE